MNTGTKVKEVMSQHVLVAHPEYSFTKISRLFHELKIHHLPVIDQHNELIGMVSSTDTLYMISRGSQLLSRPSIDSLLAVDLMSSNVITISPDQTIEEAAQLFIEKDIKALPVVVDRKLQGIITSNDLVRFMAKQKQLSH